MLCCVPKGGEKQDENPSEAGTAVRVLPSSSSVPNRAKLTSRATSRSLNSLNSFDSPSRSSVGSYDEVASGFNNVSRKPSRSYDDVSSSSDDPEEMTAQVVDALRGSKAWQMRQMQMQQKSRSSHVQKTQSLPRTTQAKEALQAGNEGRVLISQETLLRWLKAKAA